MKISSSIITILLIPLAFFISENLAFSSEGSSLKIKTIVIDPGHGGKDPGCVRNGIFEKDVVLSVGLKLGKLIQDSLPGIRVVYTRSSDEFVELQKRADIANRNRADLFISIHINANKSGQPRGSETFCMGLNMTGDNMEVCRMENSVITLEEDYSSKYEGFEPNNPESYIIFSLLQNSNLEQSLKLAENIQSMYKKGPITRSRGVGQAGFVVLWKCSAPAVLTELGFLTNDEDFKILSDKRKHQLMASNIYNAVKMYRSSYEFTTAQNDAATPVNSTNAPVENTAAPLTDTNDSVNNATAPVINTNSDEPKYAIQVLSSPKYITLDDHELKGLDCYHVKVGRLNKYLTGSYQTIDEAKRDLPRIKELFHDAFIINLPIQ